MPLDKHLIMGVHITDRVQHVAKVQQTLTELGSSIKTRLGLHDVEGNFSSPNGLLLLELVGKEEDMDALSAKLNAIEGVEAKTMTFAHP